MASMIDYLEQIADTDLIWLAAAIDCDGCVTDAEIAFYNTNRKLMDKAAYVMCSRVRILYNKPGRKTMYITRLTGERKRILYEHIKKYLITK